MTKQLSETTIVVGQKIIYGVIGSAIGLIIGWNIRQQTTIDNLSIQSAKLAITQEHVMKSMDQSNSRIEAMLATLAHKN